MISSISLKFGRSADSAPEKINLTPLTIFVGPNNSGKSRVLAELDHRCRNGNANGGEIILDKLDFATVHRDEIDEYVQGTVVNPLVGEHLPQGYRKFVVRGDNFNAPIDILRSALANPASNPSAFSAWYLRYLTLKLDGPNRINLVNAQSAGDLKQPAFGAIQFLFRNNPKREKVRKIIKEALNEYFVIDPTNLGQLHIRLSDKAPIDELEEKGIHDAAVAFHSRANRIEEASDGVKAFVGIVTELHAGNPKVLLIDEPEAFLHPALASRLGYEIAMAATESDKRVFVSTHSPMFVMGCIQSGVPINIVRLTYRSGVPTARILPSHELIELMRNPLLRSSNVLSGLFYEFVVVAESDADRAFYQEVNERLLRFMPDWGITNCLFLNAQNKQTVHTILRPLRKLGIPAAGIVDVDIVKEGGKPWQNVLDGAQIPEITKAALSTSRGAIRSAMDRSGKDMKRQGGLNILEGAEREACSNLFAQLASYGVFVVPSGELESWLKHLNVSGHGPSWLIGIFEKMGEDVNDPDYVKPTKEDVWRFLYTVREWFTNPLRAGIPN